MGDARGIRRTLRGFGNHPAIEGFELRSDSLTAITEQAVLSRGLGRSYGDAALPPADATRPVAVTDLADRMLEFDPRSGLLRAEAGLSLAELARVFLRQGWFSPVSPGTAHVTLGGMVAADVHGKNHHVGGTLGRHVERLRMRVASGRVLDVSRREEPELFRATLGGMGLTGHILEVTLRLERVPSAWISRESEQVPDVAALLWALREASRDWPMTVAWLDTSHARGRGIVHRGRWAAVEEAPPALPRSPRAPRLPFTLPHGVLNAHTIRLANALWYHAHGPSARTGLVTPNAWFWPLDAVRDWPRAYGPHGFTQYQCVVPSDPAVVSELLARFRQAGGMSFVTVVKDCGAQGEGMLSFPKPGVSLSFDVPIRARTRALVDALNDFAVEHGGRIYLAKDAFTRPEHFRAMYPELGAWLELRRKWDPERRISSAQSRRLLGEDG
jgi:decaprenylphospho-beta-D-ribofuranose 2-oxidase